MIPNVPVTSSRLMDWMRAIANAINALIAKTVQRDGADIYAGDTAGGAYDQTKMQALMDAVEALSLRVK